MIRYIYIVAILAVFTVSRSIAQETCLSGNVNLPVHPRLLLLAGEEEQIRNKITSVCGMSNINYQIISESDSLLQTVPVERIQIGMRLLDKSREALRRIYFLSYAWRMTGQEKYLERGEEELLAIAAFSDWNPSHFLDVAEMTTAAAIGYDWLYHGLSQNSRNLIKNAILQKGLEPSMDPNYNRWLTSTTNWNQVCNTGMALGALAIYEDYPELGNTIVNRAVNSIQLPMADYNPNGGYPEGFAYWGYGTNYNVLFLAAMERLFPNCPVLDNQSGFMQTASYKKNMTGPSGNGFNFSDSGLRSELQPDPAMFWFAGKQQDNSLLWVENKHFLNTNRIENVKNRLLPSVLVWSKDLNLSQIPAPADLMWHGAGKTPVAIMRGSWTAPNTLYLAVKGGSPSTNHAHMDIGSFVMEANGIRWAMDFGSENYTAIEAQGISLFNMRQNSPRWDLFRYNNKGHNTLSFNNFKQNVEANAPIISTHSTAGHMNAIIDLTDTYQGQVQKVSRGTALIDKEYVIIRDEIESLDSITVRWNMLTSAQVTLINNKAELTKNGKKLFLEVREPSNTVVKTWSTVPPNNYESANQGTVFVGFETKIPANTKIALSVLLIPETIVVSGTQHLQCLSDWP